MSWLYSQAKLQAAVKDEHLAVVVIPAAHIADDGRIFELGSTGQRQYVDLQVPEGRRLVVLGVKYAFEALDAANLMRSSEGENHGTCVPRCLF
jgi:hypothetical protein